MGLGREKGLQGDPKGRGLDELVERLVEEHLRARPGKHTLIEQALGAGLARGASPGVAVGRKTLLDLDGQEPAQAAPAPVIDPAASPRPGSRPAFSRTPSSFAD